MPNYFAQLQNALADFPTAAKIKRQVGQQEFQNRLAQQEMAGQQRQRQVENVIATSREQRLRQKAGRQERELSMEERKERVNYGGPLAMQALQNPVSWPSIRQRMKQFDPDAPIPESYEEALPTLQNLASMYQQQQEPVGVEYMETGQGVVGLPKEVRPGQPITPMETGVQSPPEPEEPSAKQEEIQRYLRTGVAKDEAEATKLAEGLYEVVGPDVFGRSYLVDTSPKGGVVREIGTAPGVEKADPEKTPATKGEKESFLSVQLTEEALGPFSAAKQLINNIIGPFAADKEMFPETEEARNKIRMFNQRIKPYFMVSNRGNTYEMKNMDRFLPSPDRFAQDPDAAKSMLRNLHQMLTANIESKQNLLRSGGVTAKQREEFIGDINKLQTAISLLPDKSTLGMPLTETDVRDMSTDELLNLTEDEINSLTPEAEAIIIEKARKATTTTQGVQ